jgi:hypothetical protein
MTPRDALRPILAAGPGARARLRLIDVACPRNHRLLEVFRAAPRPVVLWRPEGEQIIDAVDATAANRAIRRYPHRVEWFRPLRSYDAWCRCGGREVDGTWLMQQIQAGRRRAVVTDPDAAT